MTAAPAIKGWCPTLLSPMQSGDGWLARVKPSAGMRERRSCAADRRRRAPPRQRPHRPHLARQFAGQGTQPPLGGSLRRDHHRRRSRQCQPARSKPSAMSWRARSGPTIPPPPSTLMPSRATSKRCSRASPRFGRCRRNSASSSMAAACCRWQTSPPTLWCAPGRAMLAVQLDGGTLAALVRASSLAETVKALALAFLRLSAQRSEKPRRMRALVMAVGEEAIFAEAGLTAAHAPARLTPEAKSPIGLISLGDQARSAFGVGLPFGRIEADALHALADISERYGDGSLRTTPWRALLLTGVAAARRQTTCRRSRRHSASSPTPPIRASTSSPVSARRPA